MIERILLWGLVLVLALGGAATGTAAVYTVDDDGPADFKTIQDAINKAGSGDTIQVKAGRYSENIILKSGIDILGEGYEQTILSGLRTVSVVLADAVVNAKLDGFTIYNSGSDHSYAGVSIYGGNVVISNNRIINNANGIRILSGSSAIIRNNLITINGNDSNSVLDYGILCLRSTPLISNNVLIDNRDVGIYIGWEESAGAQIINNTIVDHPSSGIWCYRASAIVKNNIVAYNQTGISASHGAVPSISFNDVWKNAWRDYDAQSGGVAEPGPGDISQDPLFDADYPGKYYLSEESPCVDAGDPSPVYDDIDGSRNDMGAYGGMSGLPNPAFSPILTGFLFTSIGKIPTSEITQSGDTQGLANVSPEVAQDLGIYRYTDAPFGGRLWISGLFGLADGNVRYYQILAAKWDGDIAPTAGDFEPLTYSLTKIRYIINSDGTVNTQRVTVGPLTVGSRKNLYARTDTGYWAHRDLKIIWNTAGQPNGKYDMTYRAFSSTGTEIPLPANALSRITVVVDNSPVQADIHTVKYDNGDVIPECGIIDLSSPTDNLKFLITAWHPNGYLRRYNLAVLYGENKSGGSVKKDQYVGSNDGIPPVWFGVDSEEFNSIDAPVGQLAAWKNCGYQFRLRVWGRTTDGYHHIRYNEFNDHYYLNFGTQNSCKGDITRNGVVDGDDLLEFADDFGRTDCLD